VLAAAPRLSEAVILVKPQFEAGRGNVGKGGIVRDPEVHKLAVDRVADCVSSLGWQVTETMPSPITGAEATGSSSSTACGVNLQPIDVKLSFNSHPLHWDRMVGVAIVCKPHKEELARLLPELVAWLRARGFEPFLDCEGGALCSTAPVVDRAQMPLRSPGLVIVLGGTGHYCLWRAYSPQPARPS